MMDALALTAAVTLSIVDFSKLAAGKDLPAGELEIYGEVPARQTIARALRDSATKSCFTSI